MESESGTLPMNEAQVLVQSANSNDGAASAIGVLHGLAERRFVDILANSGAVCLGDRALLELGEYIKEVGAKHRERYEAQHPEAAADSSDEEGAANSQASNSGTPRRRSRKRVGPGARATCVVCEKAVQHGYACPECKCKAHFACVKSWTRDDGAEGGVAACKKCKALTWPSDLLFPSKRLFVNSVPLPGFGHRAAPRDTNPAAAVVEVVDDDDDDSGTTRRGARRAADAQGPRKAAAAAPKKRKGKAKPSLPKRKVTRGRRAAPSSSDDDGSDMSLVHVSSSEEEAEFSD